MVKSVFLGFLVAIGCCRCDNATNDSENVIPGSSIPAPTIMDTVYKAVMSCAERDGLSCLRKRAVFLLDRAATLDKLPVWGDTIVLVKSATNSTTSDDTTDRSVGESFANFLDTRRVQLRLPRLSYFLPVSEGRGKKNNKGYGLLAMTIAGAMMAMGMAGLAAMAGKALAASMAALMLALMAALRSNKGGGHHGDHSSYEVISIPAHHHHRSFANEQNLNVNNPYRYDTEGHVHETR